MESGEALFLLGTEVEGGLELLLVVLDGVDIHDGNLEAIFGCLFEDELDGFDSSGVDDSGRVSELALDVASHAAKVKVHAIGSSNDVAEETLVELLGAVVRLEVGARELANEAQPAEVDLVEVVFEGNRSYAQ